MSLIKNNSQDDFKLSNPEIYEANLNSKAKELKNKLETADIDLKKSSFSNLLVDSENEKDLTDEQRKLLAKRRLEIARKKKEELYMKSLEKAKENLISASTKIDVVNSGVDKGMVEIDMDLEKLSLNESGERVEMHDVFTPDVMAFSIKVTQENEDGDESTVLDKKVERGVVNGRVVYFYVNEDREKVPLEIPTRGKASISISRKDMMNKSKSEIAELMKNESLLVAQKEAKEGLSQVSADDLSIKEKPSVKKRRVSSDVAMEVIGSNSNKRGSSNSSYKSSRKRAGGSTRRRSSSRTSEHSHNHSHDVPSNRSFEVTSELSKEPIVSIPHKWCNPGKVLRLRFTAMQAFLKAQEIAKKDGYELRVFSAYRTKKHQARLWAKALRKYGSPAKADDWVAPPGRSNHQTGGTIDLKAVNLSTGKKDPKYLKKILPALGFENYKKENWHWEYKSGRSTGKPNVYGKIMSVKEGDIIPYETYLAKVEENKKKEMLANKPGVIEEGVNSKFSKEIDKFKGLKWAGRLSGNGGRDVAILVPPHFDASKPAKILYHFHGSESERWEKGYMSKGVNIPENRFNQAATQLSARSDSNTIMIYPISAGVRGASKRSDSDWMHTSRTNGGDNMERFHSEVLDVIGSKLNLNINVGEIAAQGHSAGGKPLRNAAQSGFAFDKIVFLDASYGRWGRDCYAAAIKNNPNVDFRVVYKPNTQTHKDAISLKNKTNVNLIPTSRRHGNMNTDFFDGEFRA